MRISDPCGALSVRLREKSACRWFNSTPGHHQFNDFRGLGCADWCIDHQSTTTQSPPPRPARNFASFSSVASPTARSFTGVDTDAVDRPVDRQQFPRQAMPPGRGTQWDLYFEVWRRPFAGGSAGGGRNRLLLDQPA